MNRRKIGVFTSAIALIAMGIIMALHVSGAVSYHVLRYLWPILIILFGIEVIWTHYTTRDAKVRYSGWSVALLVIVMLFSVGDFTFQSSIGPRLGSGYAEPIKGQVKVDRGIREVVIDLRNTPVTITGTTSSVLSYDGVLKVNASSQTTANQEIHADWSVRQVGDTLEMTLVDTGLGVNISLGGWLSESPHLDVKVPKTLLSKVVTTNSSVHVTQMNAASDVHTSNGSVTVEHIKADVSASTTNGSITLQDIAGKIEAGTTNGSIKGTSKIAGAWTCTTTNGSIRLQLSNNANAKLTASTTNGRIGGNVPWTFDDKEHGTSTVGTGANQVNLRTTNGSVTVNAGD